MAHNPRRDKSVRTPGDPLISDAMVADAMQRAHALRCHRGIDPATVELVPLDAHDAMVRMVRRWCAKYGTWVMNAATVPPEPWWLVGWLAIEVAGIPRFWGVWLNHEDQRVHLRIDRHWRDADDPYP